jgi:hypothetical protein
MNDLGRRLSSERTTLIIPRKEELFESTSPGLFMRTGKAYQIKTCRKEEPGDDTNERREKGLEKGERRGRRKRLGCGGHRGRRQSGRG